MRRSPSPPLFANENNYIGVRSDPLKPAGSQQVRRLEGSFLCGWLMLSAPQWFLRLLRLQEVRPVGHLIRLEA